jgi:hypothetical protein
MKILLRKTLTGEAKGYEEVVQSLVQSLQTRPQILQQPLV